MKTKIFIGILSVLSLSAMAKGHWYAGVGGGYTTVDSTVYGREKIYDPNIGTFYAVDTQKLSNPSFIGQLQGGYFKNFDTFFALGEIFLNGSQNRASEEAVYVYKLDPNQRIVSTLTKKHTKGFSGKIGLPINSNWGVFAGMSILNAQFNFKRAYVNTSVNVGESKTLTTWGFAPSLGMIYRITPNMPLRLEYTYEIYKTLQAQLNTNKTSDGPGVNVLFTGKVKPRYHTIMLSLSYEF
jgi:opacity protein-like surface antigen